MAIKDAVFVRNSRNIVFDCFMSESNFESIIHYAE